MDESDKTEASTPRNSDTVEDLITLAVLDEHSLLSNIKARFTTDLIYTWVGSILVSVNPYQVLPIYLPSVAQKYIAKANLLPPHIFAVSDKTYKDMRREEKNQSVLISGESGAGKTEATKLILQYLAALTSKRSRVEQMILEASPILEAFGNAKTVRNNNSSRFGRFSEIQFGSESTGIVGARIVDYLLEKSRVVYQAPTERNYHIFYQLCAGATDEERVAFKMKTQADYNYLNQSGCITVEGVDDADDFDQLRNSFTALNILPDTQAVVFRILSAILHLGNVQFQAKGDGCEVSSGEAATSVADLLQVDLEKLKQALTVRQMNVRGQIIVVNLKLPEAVDSRDALAKALYGKLFSWLVRTINTSLSAPPDRIRSFIGILDIFGFENFKVNSFEQFCINYANERLQQHFNQHIFKIEEEEYRKEKIDWTSISFVDNQDCLDLIEKRPLGILSILDEECKFPKSTDLTFLAKMHQNLEKTARYEKPRLSKVDFGVEHFAGKVTYNVTGFLDKNKDTLQDDLKNVCLSSKEPLVKGLFAEEEEAVPAATNATMKKGALTVGAQFKTQLQALMATLSATTPHYVRCVKPNMQKKARIFEDELVSAQLRYAGMLETIRIRKLGFPQRFLLPDFYDRYKALVPELMRRNPKDRDIDTLLAKVPFEKGQWLRGITKVFLKDKEVTRLGALRDKALHKYAVVIQAGWRMYYIRSYYQNLRENALVLQTAYRVFTKRNLYLHRKSAAITIESFARMVAPRLTFKRKRRVAANLSNFVRGWLGRKHYLHALALDREKKRLMELRRMAQEEALERARMEEEARIKREEEERKERERQELLRKQKEEADERERKRLEEEEKKRMEADKKYRAKVEAERKERERLEKLRLEEEAKEKAALEEAERKRKAQEEEEERKRKAQEEGAKRKKEEEDRKFKERMEELKVKEKEREEREEEAELARVASRQGLGFAHTASVSPRGGVSPTSAPIRPPPLLISPHSAESVPALQSPSGSIDLPAAIQHQLRVKEAEEAEKKLSPEPTPRSTVEKGNRPVRPGKIPRHRSSTLGAIHPSYFTLRSTPRLESDEELSILSLANNVPRGTHFWMGRESDLEGVTTTGGETARALAQPTSLSHSVSQPLERAPPSPILSPTSPLAPASPVLSPTSSPTASPTSSPTIGSSPASARSRWSGALSTLRNRSTSTSDKKTHHDPTGLTRATTTGVISPPPNLPTSGAMASPRLTLTRQSLSSPRASALSGREGVPATPRTTAKLFANLTATLRGTPRSSQESHMITIDAPLFPLLLVDKTANGEKKDEVFSLEPKVTETNEEPYTFNTYARNNFVPPQKSKKKAWTKLESYTTKLKRPLLPCTEEQALIAVEIFGKIREYIDAYQPEGAPPADERAQIRWVLDRAFRAPPVRNEAYSQVLKQVQENPNPGALDRAIVLLTHMCGTFAPSNPETLRVLQSFLSQQDTPASKAARIALQQTLALPNKSREAIPSIIEIELGKSGKTLQAVVQISSGALRAVDVDYNTTANNLVTSISMLLGIPIRKHSPYGIYEGFHGLERLIKPETRLYDVISKWESYGVTMTERNIPTAFSLHFKRFLYLNENGEPNAVERELDFHQAKTEIHKGVLPCREEDATKLAALLYSMDTSLTKEQAVDRFIPRRLAHKHTVDEWFDLITSDAKQIEEESGKLSRSTIIAVYGMAVRQLPIYGSAVFRVQHMGAWALPSELDIAINQSGLLLLDPISKDKIKTLPFTHILRWYATSSGLSVVTAPRYSREDNTVLVLQTSQASQISLILNLYFAILLESMNEVQALADFTPTEPGYIPFKKGDIITVNSKHSDTHYNATFNGQTGLVPCELLQLVVEGELAPIIDDADSVASDKATVLFDAEGKSMKVARVVRIVGSSEGEEPAPEAEPVHREIKRKLWLEVFAMNHFRKLSTKVKKSKASSLFKSKKDFEQFDVTERLMFTKENLVDSLLDLGEDATLNEDAVDMFSNVQKAMGDYPSTKHPDVITYELIAKASARKELRDELFCQLAKQVTNNPKPSSIMRGLELVCLAAGCFVPSPNLYGIYEEFLSHLPNDVRLGFRPTKKSKEKKEKKKKDKPEPSDGEITADELPDIVTRLAKEIHRRMEMTWQATGERECAPSFLEMDAVKKMKPINIKIQMSYGSFIVISIDSSTIISEAFDKVIKKTQLLDPSNYYLYFFVGNAERCLTNENEKVCDLITKAEHLTFETTSGLHHTPFGTSPIFGIRIRGRHLPHPIQPKDIAELDLVFYQVVENVMYGRYPCTFEDAMHLGGLMVQACYGDYNPSNPIINENTLPQFLRSQFLTQGRDKMQIAEDLNAHHASRIGMPSTEAKSQFLKIYSEWKWAEASFFLVHQPRKTPPSLMIVITVDKLYFLDPTTLDEVESHGFEVLSTWGCTGTTFNVKVGSLMKPINLIFNTTQGSEICLVLKSRVQADKSVRQYASPTSSPSLSPASSFSTPVEPDTPQPAKELKKPVVPTLQLSRAKMFNFE